MAEEDLTLAKEKPIAAPDQPAGAAETPTPTEETKGAKETTPAKETLSAKDATPAEATPEAKDAAPAEATQEAKDAAPAEATSEAKDAAPAETAEEAKDAAKPKAPIQPSANRTHKLAKQIYTAGGLGLLPMAPGTWGTLMGIPIYFLLSLFNWHVYLIGVAIVFLIGWWAASIAEKDYGHHDDKRVVVDEVFGYLIAMFLTPFPLPWWGFIVGFALFRVFDIFKFGPVRYIDEKVGGGLGVMLDDGMAGVYAYVVMFLTGLIYKVIWAVETSPLAS